MGHPDLRRPEDKFSKKTPFCNRPSEKPSLPGWPIFHWVGFINRIWIVAVFLLFFCSFGKIRWVCKSHTEQSLGKHKNGRVKSKYSLGTGEAKFPLGRENNPLGRIPLGLLQRVVKKEKKCLKWFNLQYAGHSVPRNAGRC